MADEGRVAPTSYGVIVFDENDCVLLCHATNKSFWDLPKGEGNPGESPLEAALRETKEETGLTLDADRLVDLGESNLASDKKVHFFAIRMTQAEVSIEKCVCLSTFELEGGLYPEVDAYSWASINETQEMVGRKLKAVLDELDLYRLARRV